ncbi:MAG: hypothetical protein KDD37_01915 [Bdellovibrionales bacterium]|nr:hypothetical protein [Bdellovibrionales bacterium]
MKAFLTIISFLALISCASSSSEVKHTIVIKGINDGNTPTTYSIKVYTLYAGSDCNNLEIYRRFGTTGKYFEFFKNNSAIIASARPTDDEVFGCVAIEFSNLFKATCDGNTRSVEANFAGGTDIDGNVTTGPDGKSRIAMFLTPATPLDTANSRDFYFVASGITDCVSAAAANFTLSETNPLP